MCLKIDSWKVTFSTNNYIVVDEYLSNLLYLNKKFYVL